jgi:hypothetical protein
MSHPSSFLLGSIEHMQEQAALLFRSMEHMQKQAAPLFDWDSSPGQ